VVAVLTIQTIPAAVQIRSARLGPAILAAESSCACGSQEKATAANLVAADRTKRGAVMERRRT
jgi:hypothetical protein